MTDMWQVALATHVRLRASVSLTLLHLSFSPHPRSACVRTFCSWHARLGPMPPNPHGCGGGGGGSGGRNGSDFEIILVRLGTYGTLREKYDVKLRSPTLSSKTKAHVRFMLFAS